MVYNFSRLKMFWGWKCLEAEIVSGLKVSPNCSRGWKFLPTESFSQLKVSRSRKCLRAESVSRLKVSRSRKCLRAEIVATESVSGLKVSFTLMAESVWRLKMSGLQISRDGNCLRAESVLETLVVQDFCFWAIWAAGPILKKKTWDHYEQLLRAVFSSFHGQKVK